MIDFSAAETTACCRLIELALQEDLGREPTFRGDVTSFFLIPPGYQGKATFVARTAGVLAGLPAIKLVCGALDQRLEVNALTEDGAALQVGTKIAQVSGPSASILAAERTALNFVQRLSGIATLTRRYVEVVAGLPCRILDTRKTAPGYRFLEKYAVRCGGGQNHRMGLYDEVLIKDNHLAATRNRIPIDKALRLVRQETFGKLAVEIEVENLQQLEEAIKGRPDIILLDNMSLQDLRDAVRRRQESAPNVLLEASGGVTLETARSIAETGVDRISVGALTHSAPALDIALDYEPA
jgi:nicotinate-nucleotide pyrophosphorylase (carboxylating)